MADWKYAFFSMDPGFAMAGSPGRASQPPAGAARSPSQNAAVAEAARRYGKTCAAEQANRQGRPAKKERPDAKKSRKTLIRERDEARATAEMRAGIIRGFSAEIERMRSDATTLRRHIERLESALTDVRANARALDDLQQKQQHELTIRDTRIAALERELERANTVRKNSDENILRLFHSEVR